MLQRQPEKSPALYLHICTRSAYMQTESNVLATCSLSLTTSQQVSASQSHFTCSELQKHSQQYPQSYGNKMLRKL